MSHNKISFMNSISATLNTIRKLLSLNQFDMVSKTGTILLKTISIFEHQIQKYFTTLDEIPSDFKMKLIEMNRTIVDLFESLDRVTFYLDDNKMNAIIRDSICLDLSVALEEKIKDVHNILSNKSTERLSEILEIKLNEQSDNEESDYVMFRFYENVEHRNEGFSHNPRQVDSGYVSMTFSEINAYEEKSHKNSYQKQHFLMYMQSIQDETEDKYDDENIYEYIEPPEKSTNETNKILTSLDISEHILIESSSNENNIKGGHVDALIVQATYINNIVYGEAFISTFRTFIKIITLLEKLIVRYMFFAKKPNPSDEEKRSIKETFCLFIRIVDTIMFPEITDTPEIINKILNFIYELIRCNSYKSAHFIREKLHEKIISGKHDVFAEHNKMTGSGGYELKTSSCKILDILTIKPQHLAEQLTILDEENLNKIQIPELVSVTETKDPKLSENLIKFIEHFNNISLCVKTQILKEESEQKRKKYINYYLDVIKELRKLNNFSSCLAIISALGATSISRLDYFNQGDYSEYFDLSNPGMSHKIYRSATDNIQGQCIPHLAVILSDLEFIKQGNPKYLQSNIVNFVKCKIQHSVLDKFKRCQNPCNDFRTQNKELIESFLNEFKDNLDDEQLYQLSLAIKPRTNN